jgi:hypothetical protein
MLPWIAPRSLSRLGPGDKLPDACLNPQTQYHQVINSTPILSTKLNAGREEKFHES